MHLIAVIRIEGDLAAASQAVATVAKGTAYDARLRLAAGPPSIIARVEESEAPRALETLASARVAAVSLDERVPSRADRLCAQKIDVGAEILTFTSRRGESKIVYPDDVMMSLRGVRTASTTTKKTETISRPAMKGGARTEKVTTSSTNEKVENLVLIYLGDGACVEVSEDEMQWTSLGTHRQLSGPANVQWVASELKRRAPNALHDERLVQLGRRALPLIGAAERGSSTDRSETVDVIAAVLHRARVLSLI